MFCSSFQSKEDHESINAALAIFPTLAIFMSVVVEQGKKKKASKKMKLRSILDAKDTTTIKCLAAVNYFREHVHTQVLCLATTLEEPPTESIHCMWQKLGLGTHLLCMLVKQHTGIGNGGLEDSVITLQASHERKKGCAKLLFEARIRLS
jgi:hypothetical protein